MVFCEASVVVFLLLLLPVLIIIIAAVPDDRFCFSMYERTCSAQHQHVVYFVILGSLANVFDRQCVRKIISIWCRHITHFNGFCVNKLERHMFQKEKVNQCRCVCVCVSMFKWTLCIFSAKVTCAYYVEKKREEHKSK